MSGNRYVLDTNAIVALLQGNFQLIELLKDADWLGISVIS
jgi:predicted nucleic acid-binding protein